MEKKDNVLFVDRLKDVQDAIAAQAAWYSKIFVLCDENTLDNCYPLLAEDFEVLNEAEIMVIEPGEASKNWDIAHHLFAQLLEFEADKRCLLINLGGGVVTDLGGWVAANYKRGIHWINIPTTLMAMTDAAIGGKCGIDLLHHKNMIGVIAFPIQTIVCPEFLETLPHAEIRSGQGEMIKHALLNSRDAFDEVLAWIASDTLPDTDAIIRSASVKLEIVDRDPLEEDLRKSLNLGHTVGHAVESYFMSIDQPIAHGIAVAAGIAIEARLSAICQLLSDANSTTIAQHCKQLFELNAYAWPPFEAFAAFLSNDKKNSGGKLYAALLQDYGNCVPAHPVTLDEIKAAYQQFLDGLMAK